VRLPFRRADATKGLVPGNEALGFFVSVELPAVVDAPRLQFRFRKVPLVRQHRADAIVRALNLLPLMFDEIAGGGWQ
jgi:hypothetical protein